MRHLPLLDDALLEEAEEVVGVGGADARTRAYIYI